MTMFVSPLCQHWYREATCAIFVVALCRVHCCSNLRWYALSRASNQCCNCHVELQQTALFVGSAPQVMPQQHVAEAVLGGALAVVLAAATATSRPGAEVVLDNTGGIAPVVPAVQCGGESGTAAAVAAAPPLGVVHGMAVGLAPTMAAGLHMAVVPPTASIPRARWPAMRATPDTRNPTKQTPVRWTGLLHLTPFGVNTVCDCFGRRVCCLQ
jgi:hypothetical protein